MRAGVESVEIRGTKSVYYRVHLFGNLAFGNISFLMASYIQNKKSNYILHVEGMWSNNENRKMFVYENKQIYYCRKIDL